ncbi:MAG: C25 family cysteine peptidase, partial [Fibrobacterota bacterium]
VIRYDYSFEYGPRGNRALLLADDTRQGSSSDPLRFSHFTSAETIARETALKQFELTKLYLSMYDVNENYRHEEARQVFLNEINRGQKWVLFFGHGCPAYVSDEVTVHANDVDHFAQESEPFFFYSFSCRNGAYHIPYQESMAKRFLFKGRGGALAFVASTALEYSTPSLYFARYLFSVLDTVPDVSIGRMTLLAKRNAHNMGVQYYHLLGDPAIRAGGRRTSPALSFSGGNLSVQVNESFFSSGTYYLTVSSIDTLRLPEDTARSYVDGRILYTEEKEGGSVVDFDLSAFSEQQVKVFVYVTDGNAEGRADTSLILENSSAALPRIASVPGEVRIQNRGGQLRVHYTARERGVSVSLVMFDLRGRKIFENTLSSPSFLLDLKKQGIGPGNYLLRVKEGERTVAQRGLMLVH